MPKPSPIRDKSPVLQQLVARAMESHQRGDLAAAEPLYLQALAARPDHFEARHLLGVLRGQQGRYAEALELVAAALELRPDMPGALSNYGLILHKMERHQEALASFERALAIRPDNAEALSNRGNVLSALRRYDDALASYDRALAARPDYAEALNNRGLALEALGRHEEALRSYVKALLVRPDYAEALYHRGNMLARLARFEEALRCYDRAVAIKPDYAEAFDNRGNALAKLKRSEEALASYDQALALRPDYVGALNNRGITLEELRQCEEALLSYDRALSVRPDDPEALGNRGNVLSRLKCYEEALASYDRALAIRADDGDTWLNRANTLAALRRYEQAAASYERALAINPDDANAIGGLAGAALAVCNWRRAAEFQRQLAARADDPKSPIGPFALLNSCDDPALLLRCAQNFVAHQIPVPPPPLCTTVGTRAGKPRRDKIRVAYLSADFRSHVTAYQLAELFELHDRSRFEVIGVSFSRDDGSDIRGRLIKAFDQFIDVYATSDRDVANLLHEREVDIAVDLMGHTLDARLPIFAYRPAPIQVTYHAYASTTGAAFIDYIIGDRVVLPADHQPFYSEQIVRLPECFLANDTQRAIAQPAPARQEAGLPEQGFVFCCFNNMVKLQPAMFDIWMRMLLAVEGSVLWLSLRYAEAQSNLQREAQARGVDPGRLVFAQRVPKIEDHLARHRLADLFLDTLPYNAHATAGDALWAGLPVLTCCGKTYGARVAASLLQAVGLPELVTESLADYEALGLKLARDSAQLGGLRHRLEQNRHTYPLFDTKRLCRHLEDAYATMWDIAQRGQAPEGFDVPARGWEH